MLASNLLVNSQYDLWQSSVRNSHLNVEKVMEQRGFLPFNFLKGSNTFTMWFHFIYYRSMWSVIYAYLFWGDTDTDNGVITDDHTLLIISDRPRVSSNTGGAFQPSTQLITLRPRTINTGEKTATSYVITCTWSLNLSM